MSRDTPIATTLDDIAKAEPAARARADAIRDRVMPLFETDEFRSFHHHLFAEAFGFAPALGTTYSDIEAGYQAAIIVFLDSAAMLQAVSRRIAGVAGEDAPGSLALGAYAAAQHVTEARQEMIANLIREFHPQAAEAADVA